MKQEWYVSFRVKHENAVANGCICDYYAVKCDNKEQTRIVTSMLKKYRNVKYTRVVHGSLDKTVLKKRKVLTSEVFFNIVNGLNNA